MRDQVWGLSLMNTGMFVPFVTNSTAIAVRYSLQRKKEREEEKEEEEEEKKKKT